MIKQSTPVGHKYPLLVYRFIARRYRPSGVLLFVVGLILQIPRFLPVLKLPTTLPPETLSLIGLAALASGAGLWILSLYMVWQSYVQCKPDYLVIHAPFNRVVMSYSRIISSQSVRVSRIFEPEKLKARDRQIIKPLLPETAIEVELQDWPVPESQLRRYFSKFLFSTRQTGFIFIVPAPANLNNEINSFTQRALDRRDAFQQRYLDPIERMRQDKSTLFR